MQTTQIAILRAQNDGPSFGPRLFKSVELPPSLSSRLPLVSSVMRRPLSETCAHIVPAASSAADQEKPSPGSDTWQSVRSCSSALWI